MLDLELLVQDVDLHGLPLDAIKGHSFRRLWGIQALLEGIQVIRLKADRDFIAFDDREINSNNRPGSCDPRAHPMSWERLRV